MRASIFIVILSVMTLSVFAEDRPDELAEQNARLERETHEQIKNKLNQIEKEVGNLSKGLEDFRLEYGTEQVMPDRRDRRLFSTDLGDLKERLDGRDSQLLDLVDEILELLTNSSPVKGNFCTPCTSHWEVTGFNDGHHRYFYMIIDKGEVAIKRFPYEDSGALGLSCKGSRKADPLCSVEKPERPLDETKFRRWKDDVNKVSWLLVTNVGQYTRAIREVERKFNVCSKFGTDWRAPSSQLNLNSAFEGIKLKLTSDLFFADRGRTICDPKAGTCKEYRATLDVGDLDRKRTSILCVKNEN